MKKKLLLIAILCIMMIIPLRVHAENKYYGISCKYSMKCLNTEDVRTYVGTYTLIYSNTRYNQNLNSYSDSKGSFHLIYSDGSTTKVLTDLIGEGSINKNISEYPNNKEFHTGKKAIKLYIKSSDAYGNDFVTLSKSDIVNPCPKLHCSVDKNNHIYINPGNIHKDLADYYGKEAKTHIKDITIAADEALICKNNDAKCGVKNGKLETGQWKSPTESAKGETGSKEPLKCEYSLTPLGQKGESGLQATSPDEKVDVTFTTNYDENGNPNAYFIKVNDNETIVDINKNYETTFKGKTDSITYVFSARAETMKLLFTDTCLSKNNVFLYYTKNDSARAHYVITTDSNEAQKNMIDIDENGNVTGKGEIKLQELIIPPEPMTCQDILKEPLLSIVKGGITILQIVAAIITIVKGMTLFIPAVIAKDADALKKSSKQLAILGVILTLVIIFRPIIRIIGKLLEYDISCII